MSGCDTLEPVPTCPYHQRSRTCTARIASSSTAISAACLGGEHAEGRVLADVLVADLAPGSTMNTASEVTFAITKGTPQFGITVQSRRLFELAVRTAVGSIAVRVGSLQSDRYSERGL
jgi:hypothetical protein